MKQVLILAQDYDPMYYQTESLFTGGSGNGLVGIVNLNEMDSFLDVSNILDDRVDIIIDAYSSIESMERRIDKLGYHVYRIFGRDDNGGRHLSNAGEIRSTYSRCIALAYVNKEKIFSYSEGERLLSNFTRMTAV